jgi:hypothetical protein
MNPRTVSHVVGIVALVALSTLVAHPGRASAAAARPAENPACRPLAATVEHWLPILDRSAPNLPLAWNLSTPGLVRYPWYDAANAVDYYADPFTRPRLTPWINEGVTAIAALGTVGTTATDESLRQALRHIRGLCPSLPASVVNGPLPH